MLSLYLALPLHHLLRSLPPPITQVLRGGQQCVVQACRPGSSVLRLGFAPTLVRNNRSRDRSGIAEPQPGIRIGRLLMCAPLPPPSLLRLIAHDPLRAGTGLDNKFWLLNTRFEPAVNGYERVL